MKITKRQLRRIFKEEKARLISEGPDIPDVMGAMGGGKFQPRIDIDALTDEIGDRAAGGYEPSIDGSPSAYADMIIDSYLSSPPPPLDTMEGLEYVLTNHRDAVEEKILEYIGMMTEGETKMKITKRQLRRIVREAIEPSQDIQDVRKKMGLPPAETISDDDIAKAMAGGERPITWDIIEELMRRIDALEIMMMKMNK